MKKTSESSQGEKTYPTQEEAQQLLVEKVEIIVKGKKKEEYKTNRVYISETCIVERVENGIPKPREVFRLGGGKFAVINVAPPVQQPRRP